jgi:hypothetical protein
MNDRSHATSHATAVSVALSLRRGAPIGERPTAEELAALYEGCLSSDRRTEVLSYLANDEALYAQWLMFFEYAEELGLPAPAAIPVDRPAGNDQRVRRGPKTSFAGKLKRLFNIYILFPGTALAGLAVFMLFFQVSQPIGLDQLYQEYGTPAPGRITLPTRSLGNFWAEPEPERFILSQGFKAGLDRLNIDASDLNLLADEPEQPAVDSLGKESVQTLKAVGEWAALTQTQCPDQNADYSAAAEQVWLTLQARLGAMDTPYVQTLAGAAQQISAAESTRSGRVCNLSSIIASDVRR